MPRWNYPRVDDVTKRTLKKACQALQQVAEYFPARFRQMKNIALQNCAFEKSRH